uniref:Si:dkey-30j10.5 n=1 Tax=Poecilia formosa TaxID=48698 RepID=A0A096MF36_POEFO
MKMPQHITDIDISVNHAEEKQLRKLGFTQIHVDLNSDTGGNPVYLWYKTSDCPAITRIQFSFTDEMREGLVTEGYHKVDKNLNNGNSGSAIYLWFFKGCTDYDVPVVELDVSTDAQSDAMKVQPLWERSACDLNRRAGGKWIYLWMKRERQTYISDITATANTSLDSSLFRQGYTRMDEDTNRDAGGAFIFLWYRRTTDSQKAVRDLQVSTDGESEESFQNQNYQQVELDLNQGTKGSPV